MNLLNPEYLVGVFLVFARISGFFVAAPFFGHVNVPVRVRVLLSAVLAYALSGLVVGPLPTGTETSVGLLVAVAIEVLTGLALGFTAQFIFWAIQYAGELLGFQMGLGLAQVVDPSTGGHNNPMGRMLSLTFLLAFLLLGLLLLLLLAGHHLALGALVRSFEAIPLAGARVSAAGPLMLQWTGVFITTALRLASPFMITIFLVDAALGVFARVAPQADLFSIALPLKLIVGLGIFYFVVEHFMPVIPGMIQTMERDLTIMIDALRF